MKTLLILVLVVSLAMGCYIKADPTYYVKSYDFGLDLICDQAVGKVTYNVVGLPDGLIFDGYRFKVSQKGCKSGYYPVQITAKDNGNYVDNKMILFVLSDIQQNSYQSSSSYGQAGSSQYTFSSSTGGSTKKIQSSQNYIPKIQFYQGSTGSQIGNIQSSTNIQNLISSSSSSTGSSYSSNFANNLSNSIDSAVSSIQAKQTEQYKTKLEAISTQMKSIQSQITQKQSLITTVTQSIQSTTISIQTTEQKITEFTSKFEAFTKNVELITASKKSAEEKKTLLVTALGDKNIELTALTNKIKSNKEFTQQIQGQISTLEANLQTKQNQYSSNSESKKKTVEIINSLNQQISEYELKIQALKLQVIEQQVKLQTYNQIQQKIPNTIEEIKATIQNYKVKLASYSYSQYESSVTLLQTDIIPGLKAQITSQESIITQYQQQITQLTTSFDVVSYKSSITTFNQQITQYKEQIIKYNSQIKEYQSSIETLSIQMQRLTSEYNLLTELSKTTTKVITTTTSSSYGPSYGSRYQIDDWSSYLITNYGSSFGFTFPQKINYLYKYDIQSKFPTVQLTSSSSLCDVAGKSTSSYYGYVVDGVNGLFTVADNNGLQSQVRLLGCSSLMTNVDNYWPSKGDILIWRGYKQADIWNGLQATCLH